MEKYGFVYIWYDRKHKRFYIGCHWGHKDDGYICSSTWMKNSYKRRPDDFKRRILKTNITDKKEMFEEEYKFLIMIKTEELGKKYYNLQNHQFNHWYSDISKLEITKCKLVTARKNRTPNKGKTHSDEAKAKMSIAHKGKPRSGEAKLKISIAHKGKTKKPHTEETKIKMSLSHKGKKLTEEAKSKLSISTKDKPKKPFTEKHKSNLSQSHKGKIFSKEHKLSLSKSIINDSGLIFESRIKAANHYNVTNSTITKWVKRNKFGLKYLN